MTTLRSASDTKSASSVWSLWTMRAAKIASTGFLALVVFAILAPAAHARINIDPAIGSTSGGADIWSGPLQICGGDDLPSCEDFGLPVFTGPSISDGLQICPASGGGDGCPPPATALPVCFFDCDTDDSTDDSGTGDTPVAPEDEEDTLPDPVAPIAPEDEGDELPDIDDSTDDPQVFPEDDDSDNDDAPTACEQLQAQGSRIACGGFIPTLPDSNDSDSDSDDSDSDDSDVEETPETEETPENEETPETEETPESEETPVVPEDEEPSPEVDVTPETPESTPDEDSIVPDCDVCEDPGPDQIIEEPGTELPDIDDSTDDPQVTPEVNVPVVEVPVEEAPVVEAPVIEAPVIEAPVVEAPVVEEPVVEAPVEEAPVIEAPVEEAVIVEEPGEGVVIEETLVEVVIDEIILERTNVPETQVPFISPAAPSIEVLADEVFVQAPAQPQATPAPVEVVIELEPVNPLEVEGSGTGNAALVALIAALTLAIGSRFVLVGRIRNNDEEEFHSKV